MIACARFIGDRLRAAIDERGTATLAISGGSSPKPMFRQLARCEVDWSRVQLFWVDERCVPPDDPESNYGMAERELIEPAGIAPANVHRVRGELAPEEAARVYVEEIDALFGPAMPGPAMPGPGIPRFDVIHLGMGADGHTASLFPGDPRIEDRTGIASAVYVAKFDSWRVTLLPGVLLAARNTAVLATGSGKAAIIREVREGAYDPMRLPMQLVARGAGGVTWFVDE